jgi:hypothetical protein
MKSFEHFYSILPAKPYDAQKAFKTDIMTACAWNDDQFYKKKRGETKINKLESEAISVIAKRYSYFFKLARTMSKKIDDYVIENEIKNFKL